MKKKINKIRESKIKKSCMCSTEWRGEKERREIRKCYNKECGRKMNT